MKCHIHPDRDAAGYCVSCGNGVCGECKREVLGTVRCPTHATSVTPPVSPQTLPRHEKSGFLSGFISLMFPGLGHLYLGANQRAFKFGGIAIGLIVVLSMEPGRMSVLFGVSLFFLWAFAFFDAIRICHQINDGTYGGNEPVLPETGMRALRKSSSGTLTLGVILFGVGCLCIADSYLDLDRFFDFLRDNIGFIFIALGLILIAAYNRRRSREKEKELENSPPASPAGGASTSLLR